jgi:hypothetical protein
MTKAIEHIVASYVTPRNRSALEQIREHRRRLLNENRMRDTGVYSLERMNAELPEEIGFLDAALEEMGGAPEGFELSARSTLNVAR